MPNLARPNPRLLIRVVGSHRRKELPFKQYGYYDFYAVQDIIALPKTPKDSGGYNNMPQIAERDLRYLKNRLAKVASKSTAHDSKAYAKQNNPLYGHCFVVALFVRHAFGGIIVRGREPEGYGGGTHFWNILPTGQEVDLTSCQYGGDGIYPIATPELVLKMAKQLWENNRYQTLVNRLRRQPV